MPESRTRPLLIVAAFLALAGCGSGSGRDASADPELPSTSAATNAGEEDTEPATNDRGNLVKALGEESGFCADDACEGPLAVTFTVDAIAVDPVCSGAFAQPSENGHLIAVSLRAATSPDMPADVFARFAASEFRVIGPDGLTVSGLDTAAAYSCLDKPATFTDLPLGPGQQYAGQLVVDSPSPTGVLVFAPVGASAGWEWQF